MNGLRVFFQGMSRANVRRKRPLFSNAWQFFIFRCFYNTIFPLPKIFKEILSMIPLQFGQITRLVRQETVTHTYPQNTRAADYEALVNAYREATTAQNDSFNSQCNDLLTARGKELEGQPDTPRVNLYKLFNVGEEASGNCVLIDSQDLKDFAYDCMIKTQQLTDAAQQRSQTGKTDGFEAHKLNKTTQPPVAFNWHNSKEWNYTHEAVLLTLKEYWDKATDSITVTV